MCATIETGVRAEFGAANSANSAGAPRIAFAPRYATVANACRKNSIFGSEFFAIVFLHFVSDHPHAR
jgi:hypothetical protein